MDSPSQVTLLSQTSVTVPPQVDPHSIETVVPIAPTITNENQAIPGAAMVLAYDSPFQNTPEETQNLDPLPIPNNTLPTSSALPLTQSPPLQIPDIATMEAELHASGNLTLQPPLPTNQTETVPATEPEFPILPTDTILASSQAHHLMAKVRHFASHPIHNLITVVLSIQVVYELWKPLYFIFVEFPHLEDELVHGKVSNSVVNAYAASEIIVLISTSISLLLAVKLAFLHGKISKWLHIGVLIGMIVINKALFNYLTQFDFTQTDSLLQQLLQWF